MSLLTDPQVNKTTTQEPPTNPPVNVDVPEFLKGVDAELLNEASVKNIKDMNSLVKSYVHAQKMIGADKVTIPQKGATQEQWNEVFTKLGLPKKEEYKLEKEQNTVLGDEFYSKAQEIGHELGILPHQMNGFVKRLEADAMAKRDAYTQQSKTKVEDAINGLKKEWGDAFDSKLDTAKEVLKKFGDDKIVEFIQNSGLSSEPMLIKLLEKIGGSMKEAKIIEGKDSGNSPADLQGELDSILKDKNHPYWNRDHVGHAAAHKQVSELFAKLN
jgi:hypothetical protein